MTSESKGLVFSADKRLLHTILRINDGYSQDIRQMVDFLEAEKRTFDVGGVTAWVKELRRRLDIHEISVRTYNKKIAAVRHRLRFLFDRSTTSLDPAAVVRFKALLADIKPIRIPASEVRIKRNKILTPEKIEELRKAANPRLALMIEFLRDTGSRVSEMLGAGPGKPAGDGVEIQLVGKGGKMRHVKITEDLHDRIRAEFGGKRYLFEEAGEPLNRVTVTNQLRRLSVRLWGKSGMISPHSMRHSFVTEALRQRVPIEQVADYVGHSSIETTHRLYNHNAADWSTTFKDLMRGSRNNREEKK